MSSRSALIFNSAIDPNELNNPEFPWYIANGVGHYDGLDTTLVAFSRAAFNTHCGWSQLILPGKPLPALLTMCFQSSHQQACICCWQSPGLHRFQGQNRQRVQRQPRRQRKPQHLLMGRRRRERRSERKLSSTRVRTLLDRPLKLKLTPLSSNFFISRIADDVSAEFSSASVK